MASGSDRVTGSSVLWVRLCRVARASDTLALPAAWLVSSVSYEGLEPLAALGQLASFDAVAVDARGVAEREGEELIGRCLRQLLEIAPATRSVSIVEDRARRIAAAAARSGTWDVLRASELEHELAGRLAAAARMRELSRPAQPSEEAPRSDPAEQQQMVGASPRMREVFALVRSAARGDAVVLIRGEPGTGKELTALAIHERRDEPGQLVALDCASTPEATLRAKLSGVGRAGRPAGPVGTLFLDGVEALSAPLQARLVALFDELAGEPARGRQEVPSLRVIAATSSDLAARVAEGSFRADLLARLSSTCIDLPPLRERDEDALLLARYFLDRATRGSGRWLRGFSPEALAAIGRHGWPGNVRELINRVRRAAVVAEGPWITPSDLGLEGMALAPAPRGEARTLRKARAEAERHSLRDALARAHGNRAEAARILGISRTRLYELVSRHGISLPGP